MEAEPFADLDKPGKKSLHRILNIIIHLVNHERGQLINDFIFSDLYFDFYPETYPDRRGSMVPFQLRYNKVIFKNCGHYKVLPSRAGALV